MKLQKKKIGLFWLASSGLFLTQITIFSPIYLSFIIAFVLMLFYGRRISKLSLVIYFLSFTFCFTLLNSHFSRVLNLAIPFLSCILVYFYLNRSVITLKNINLVIFFPLVLLIFDGVWRFLHPDLTLDVVKLEENGILFQMYKSNSIMYMDSNAVGLQSLFLFSSILYFNARFQKSRFFYCALFLAFVSVCLSLSRSSIICMFLAVVLYFFSIYRRLFVCLFPVLLMIGFYVSYILFDFFLDDLSFQSKFKILHLFFAYIQDSSFYDLIFGSGVGNGENVLGIGAHNFIVILFVELGFFLGFLYSMFILYLFFELRYNSFVLMLPFLIASNSAGTLALPYFFSFVAFAIMIEKKQAYIVE
ncbi:hypothetical protein LZP73_11020 [Shewanella sp. AS16]|uniref:hypothetical protein n=1 Tax=Shewanella sp. AS16 TaxID=2907625 RepID=UPI001F2CBA43|nr:hypothetical protein [Shewanella sp. AS16]MCE9686738.1 hypothetical protein [Shewanella sp. AS16]